MRLTILSFVVATLAYLQAGCAAGFRAGGEHGVGAGAAIGPAPAVYPAP